MNRMTKLVTCAVAFFSLLTAQKAQPQLADSPWPMFQHDPRHSGRSPYVGPDSVQLIWTRETTHWIETSPAIGPDGTIYVCADRGGLSALRPDGSIKWYFEIDEPITMVLPLHRR